MRLAGLETIRVTWLSFRLVTLHLNWPKSRSVTFSIMRFHTPFVLSTIRKYRGKLLYLRRPSGPSIARPHVQKSFLHHSTWSVRGSYSSSEQSNSIRELSKTYWSIGCFTICSEWQAPSRSLMNKSSYIFIMWCMEAWFEKKALTEN